MQREMAESPRSFKNEKMLAAVIGFSTHLICKILWQKMGKHIEEAIK